MAVDPADAAVAVAAIGGFGTDRGVWVSSDDGATWQVYGQGLPHAPVMDLLVDETGHRLVASTLGRGVWQSVLVVP